MRTLENYIEEARESLPLCKWFIEKYFGANAYTYLFECLDAEDTATFINKLNDIWFNLPDNEFNIVVMPSGWRQFIGLLEFDSEAEEREILGT